MDDEKKRREIFARMGTQLRNNRRAFRAESLAPGAMGLYAFAMMDARAELPEIDGFIPEEVAHSAWGRPEAERRAQADALVEAGLFARVSGGYVVVRYDEHNDTRADVARNRERERTKKRLQRGVSPGDISGTSRGQGGGVLNSPSSSSDREGVQGEGPPPLDAPEPPWAAAHARRASPDLDVGAVWRGYVAHRAEKGLALTEPGWVLWCEREARWAQFRRSERLIAAGPPDDRPCLAEDAGVIPDLREEPPDTTEERARLAAVLGI